MKKTMFIVAMAMLLSRVAAAETVSFNYDGTLTQAGSAMNSYTSTSESGWTWSSGWGLVNPSNAFSVGAPDPSTVSDGTADAFNYAGANPLTIKFSTPQTGLSAEVADLWGYSTGNAAAVELIAYNASGAALGSETLTLDPSGNFLSLGITEGTADISEVAFVGLDSAGNSSSSTQYELNQYAIGSITPTPEPETFYMLGSGLLGLAGMLKMRRRSA